MVAAEGLLLLLLQVVAFLCASAPQARIEAAFP